ncbi:MAG: hypothetical protein ACRD5L_04545, partial [Bryobacteraceae bacterium]
MSGDRRHSRAAGAGCCARVAALLLVLALPLEAAQTGTAHSAEDAPPDSKASVLLRFLDGTSIHGAFEGMDAVHGVRWRHPEAKSPFDFQPGRVDFL